MNEPIYPPRRIKSFARCAGRMTPAQKLAVESVLPQYLWSKDTVVYKPLILDIGFGMGHSLAWQAEQYPQYHFLGAEVFLPGAARLATLLQEKQFSLAKLSRSTDLFSRSLAQKTPSQTTFVAKRVLGFIVNTYETRCFFTFCQRLGGLLHSSTGITVIVFTVIF
jgi:Putative methyltransferase